MEARYERLKEDQKNIQNNSFNNSFDANNKLGTPNKRGAELLPPR